MVHSYALLFINVVVSLLVSSIRGQTWVTDCQFVREKEPLLIIDDFGLKPLRTAQDEGFHDVVAERYEQAAMIVTSNLAFSEWGDAFPNKLLGAATIDRLRHAAYKIVLEGNSYRGLSNENRG